MITLEPPRRMVPDASTEAAAWQALGLSRAGLGRFLRTAQAMVGLKGDVSVLLADDRTLRRLNREWRGKDKATDILSFPALPEMAKVTAGDLAVSLEMAARQGAAYGLSLRDEVRVLLLHGLLHLAGMDHETDGGEMATREAELRRRLRLRSGLIARVSGAEAPSFSKARTRPDPEGPGHPSVPGPTKRRFPSGMTKNVQERRGSASGTANTVQERRRFPSGMTRDLQARRGSASGTTRRARATKKVAA